MTGRTVSRRVAFPHVSPLRAQHILGVLAFGVAPAVTAGIMAIGHLQGPGPGLLVFASVLAANWVLTRSRHPLHLMPFGSTLVRTLVPVLGAGLALAVLAAAGRPAALGEMVTPVIGAWIVTAFVAWSKRRFDAWRPVRIAVIGSPALAVGLAEELLNAKIRSYTVVGWIADDRPTSTPGRGPRRLGSLSQVREVVKRHSVDLLAHSNKPSGIDSDAFPPRLELFERIATDCLDLPVRLIEAGQLYEEMLGHVPLGQSNAAWFQYLLHPRYRAGSPLSKRVFDLVMAATMLLLLAPVLLVFAIAIKLSDGGPIFYRQRRVGEGGREFELIKLRSMRIDSEKAGPCWSEAGDERVTGVGKAMRRLHIDEMPQLWHILRGDMTLVGPRPEQQELIANLEQQLQWYDRRHLVKPGLAGWAQARCGYGGSEEGTSWKLCHDLYYLKHRSVFFDALILAENVRVSLRSGVQFGVRSPQKEFITTRVAG
jgi:exopolysaccharide biosynthesis polyprenyl glycosylphosphotransferase